MGFLIRVPKAKPKKIWGVIAVEGEITINDHSESLYMALDWWSVNDYKEQWSTAIARLRTQENSCFIATIHDPRLRPYIDWWLLYKENNQVFIRNSILFGQLYNDVIGIKPFTKNTCFQYIPAKTPGKQEDGTCVSEWVVALEDVINSL